MNMRKNIHDLYMQIINNEEILRLLAYQSKNFNDSPLDSSKPNILDMPVNSKFNLIDKHVLMTAKTSDITVNEKICRLCIYSGRRRPTHNYALAEQDIVFDVYVHFDIDIVDMRLTWICDTINDFVHASKFTGVSGVHFLFGEPIHNAPDGYIGYKLVYRLGSKK